MINSTWCEFSNLPAPPLNISNNHTFLSCSIANPNPNVLTAPLTILATLPNYVCSKLLPASLITVPAATNYTIQLTNIVNSTDVRAFPFAPTVARDLLRMSRTRDICFSRFMSLLNLSKSRHSDPLTQIPPPPRASTAPPAPLAALLAVRTLRAPVVAATTTRTQDPRMS